MAAPHSCFSLLLLCFTGERRSKGGRCGGQDEGRGRRKREKREVGEIERVMGGGKSQEWARDKGKEVQLGKEKRKR